MIGNHRTQAGIISNRAGIFPGAGIFLKDGAAFSFLDYDPILAFDMQESMLAAGDVPAENLDLVASLDNLSTAVGANGDATQTTSLNQPVAHVPQNGGHLYLPGVIGNYASVPDEANLDGWGDFEISIENLTLEQWINGTQTLISKRNSERAYWLYVNSSGRVGLELSNDGSAVTYITSTDPLPVSDGEEVSVSVKRVGSTVNISYNLGAGWVTAISTSFNDLDLATTADSLVVGVRSSGVAPFMGSVGRVAAWDNATQTGDPVLDIDFEKPDDHSTSFVADSGQTVTIVQSGDNPATIVGSSFSRWDGVNSVMDLDWTAASGDYFFATATADGVLSGELSLVNGASYEIGALGVPRTSNWQGGDNYHTYYYPATISAADRATIIAELGEFTDTPMFEGKTSFSSFLRAAAQLKQVDAANIDGSAVGDFSSTFQNCSSLTTVTVNGGTGNPFADSPCTTYTNAFTNTNLSQQSIDDILVAIELAATSNGTFDQSGGNAASATGDTAAVALRARGWTVTVTPAELQYGADRLIRPATDTTTENLIDPDLHRYNVTPT